MPERKAAAASQRGSTLSPTALGFIAAVAAVLVYLPSLQYGWVWDDALLVSSQGTAGVGAIGLRPLVSALYRLEWAIGLGGPLLFHLTSVALHGVATGLFFALASGLGAAPGVALLASLLFAVHPAHVEAVAHVSGRPDLLATVLALGALLVARGRPGGRPEGMPRGRAIIACSLFAAALLSEEAAILTPLILVGLDRFGPVRIPARGRVTLYAGFAAIALIYIAARAVVGSDDAAASATREIASGVRARETSVPAGVGVWLVPLAIFEYLKILVAPLHLNSVRSLAVESARAWQAQMASAVAIALVAMFVELRRRDPLARSGAIVLVAGLVPALPIAPLLGAFAMERSAYLPSVGLSLLFASLATWAFRAAPRLRPAVTVVALALTGAAALVTVVRLPAWADNPSLLRATARDNPRDPQPELALARHLTVENRLGDALEALGRAIEIDSTLLEAHERRAVLLIRLGRYEEAESAARRTLRVDSTDAVAWTNLGDALMKQGRAADAAVASERGVSLDSTIVEGWYNLGVVRGELGHVPGAIEAYERALALRGNYMPALNNLGALYGMRGRFTEAIAVYERAVAVAPTVPETQMNLALAYFRSGDRVNAARVRDDLTRIDPRAASQLTQLMREAQGAGSAPGPDAANRGATR